jgi:predicted  nucleic acid-binding Zn-ribbon protein
MTIKKSSSDSGSKKIEKDRERTWLKAVDAARAIRELIRSMKMNPEQKITLDDGINNLAKEVESMMDRIDMASTTTDKKKLLAAYKKFLERSIEVVDQRLKKID